MLALDTSQKGVSATLVAVILVLAVILIGTVFYLISSQETPSTQQAIVQAFSQKYSQPAETIEVELISDTGEFAKGSVSFGDESGGGLWFAAKTSDGWQLAYDGNGIIDCGAAEAYNFPEDLVPSCIDTENQNELISRGVQKPELIGGQKDEHGCLIAAGYSWCAPKDTCLRVWEESCYTDLGQEIQYLLADKYSKSAEEVHVTVNKQLDDYARGGVRFGPLTSSTGGAWLARKVDNIWQLSYDGNGSIDCDTMRGEYGFPDEILQPNFCD